MANSKTTVKSKTKKTSGTGKTVKSRKVTVPKSSPSEEEIRIKAKEIYHERVAKGVHGTAEEDWLNAEHLLTGSKKKK